MQRRYRRLPSGHRPNHGLAHADAISHASAERHGDPDGHSCGQRDADRVPHRHHHSDVNCDSDAERNAHGVTDGDGESHRNRDSDAVANSGPNPDANRATHGDTDPRGVRQRWRLLGGAGSPCRSGRQCLVARDARAALASALAQAVTRRTSP